MLDTIRVNLSAQPLGNDVDVKVLKIFGYPRHEGDTDCRCQQQTDASKELAGCVFAVSSGVIVDDVAKDDRIEKRKDLVDTRQKQDQYHEKAILFEIVEKYFHVFSHKRHRRVMGKLATKRHKRRKRSFLCILCLFVAKFPALPLLDRSAPLSR